MTYKPEMSCLNRRLASLGSPINIFMKHLWHNADLFQLREHLLSNERRTWIGRSMSGVTMPAGYWWSTGQVDGSFAVLLRRRVDGPILILKEFVRADEQLEDYW